MIRRILASFLLPSGVLATRFAATPCPAGFRTRMGRGYGPGDLLPDAGSL